ncbi:Spliceosome-associated protein CWC27 -like protein [Halotydeus destructor]|nr:Spliceosome-associated protein CWC27 -like protein [Halotydeus destructor]
MSNIYIQEPPTNGKVLLKTSVGDIDIELWSKEAPKACRNFIQLCLEGYYDKTIFHRIVKGFIAQGGDPSGTGLGGESIYGETFKDEFHSRLRFARRGLVAMANAGKDDNGSQFFFTLAATPELQSKHTIFGKVTGNTLYNMIKLEDCIVDQNERPSNPHKIISTEILSNPFEDIIPREIRHKRDDEQLVKKPENRSAAKKDFKLLSFGDEAEEEEEEMVQSEFKGKSKSSHDLLKDDPRLSSVPVIDDDELELMRQSGTSSKKDGKEKSRKKDKKKRKQYDELETEVVDENDLEMDGQDKQEVLKLEEAKKEYKRLKKQMADDRKVIEEIEDAPKVSENEAVVAFLEEKEKYKIVSSSIEKKGASREDQALALLEKFKSKLLTQKTKGDVESTPGPNDESWIAHKLSCEREDERPVLAKDANMRGEGDWYDLYDPRNPINQRKAAEAAALAGKKKN